jgi:hypothetical protein
MIKVIGDFLMKMINLGPSNAETTNDHSFNRPQTEEACARICAFKNQKLETD